MALVGYKDKFKDSYTINTGDDVCNVINSFYKPALSNYISYDRNAGYFSSAIFSLTYQAQVLARINVFHRYVIKE
tara:strand:+ start:419 stop:643 length:225 start_codon:yes stop_codon:yes gene_type:complete